MANILVLEDDIALNQGISYALKKEGYHVLTANTCFQGKTIVTNNLIDMIILDVNLPDGNGFDFCKRVKANKKCIVLFLSARDLEADVLTGYEFGGDDYVTKPFSMKVLLKKIAIMLKREKQDRNCYQDDFLKIDFNLAIVEVNQKVCSITPTEYRILKKFIENKGQLLTYNMFLDALWQEGVQLMDKHALAVNINRLRKKIEDENHSYITNVYGMGYIWK